VQGVNIAFHEWAQSRIYHAMARQAVLSIKIRRHDFYVKVPFTVLRASVSLVEVTLVFDYQQ